MNTTFVSGNGLLESARSVLANGGFAVQQEVLAEAAVEWLLAENDFFVLGVVPAPDVSTARRAESIAGPELLKRILSHDPGAKRWDAYVVLLSEADADDQEETREVVDLQYNTRGVRRLVAAGLHADPEAVALALRPFLPLPPLADGVLGDALTELGEQLVINGIDAALAERYVAVFAETGDLDDV